MTPSPPAGGEGGGEGQRFSLRLCASAVLLSFLTACTVGSDYVKPMVDVPAAFKEGWKEARPADELPRGKWWLALGDENLSALEEQVEVSNQTLRQAEAQYRQARALAQGTRAALLPTLSGAASNTRSLASATAGGSGAITTRDSLSLAANWEADVWGALRRNVEAGEASAQASAADLAAARLSIQAELAQDWFALRALDAQRKLLDETVAAYDKSLALTRSRYAGGVAGQADVAQAETQYQSTKAQALDLGVQRAQLEHAIALLVGQAPSGFTLPARPLSATPPAIPPSLPSALLERRPDVAAAERRAAAANAQAGVARAAFFPALTLTASGGWQGGNLANLISAPGRFWSLGPALAQTLFDGGARGARQDQAEAAYDGAVAAYRQTVLTALREVEDNLAALAILEEEARVQGEAVKAARKSLEIATNQYRAGTVSYLNVTAAQTAALSAERGATDLQSRRMAASILLIKALGGGWAS
ncbi:MAG: efflux transporter outer membrane subunit [Rhodocyclaceae bacterium]|nr:efflux transporter outer membrane subunit [Rhodocyclaceae bacterium]